MLEYRNGYVFDVFLTASKEPARVSEDVGRNKSEFGLQMKGEKSSEKSEERTSNKQLLDTKERIRNKVGVHHVPL